MKIAFLDCGPLHYNFQTPLTEPLGGSESGICYLGTALQTRGHQVTITKSVQECREYDTTIVNTNIHDCLKLRGAGYDNKIILWNGQDVDQPVCQGLTDEHHVSSFDLMILGTAWQKVQYDMHFPLTRTKSRVIRLGAGTPFREQTGLNKEPTLAYLSTPYRGLETLANVWPIIHERIPHLTLEIYSGMNLYRRPDTGFEPLYQKLQTLPNVTLTPAINQTQLAQKLAKVLALAYPATFRETFCVSLVDAMTTGCYPILSDIGALRETSVGFGRLIPYGDHFTERYADALTIITNQLLNGTLIQECSYMVAATRSYYDWNLIAQEWETHL